MYIAHFFFGTNEPEVTYYSGSKTLEDYLDTEETDDTWADSLDSIPEGSRNSTLSHKAGILIKRFPYTYHLSFFGSTYITLRA